MYIEGALMSKSRNIALSTVTQKYQNCNCNTITKLCSTQINTNYNKFPYHLYFRESVKGHWSLTIVSNRGHKAIIDCQQLTVIMATLKNIVCYVLSFGFTSAFIHAESINTPCQKVYATTSPEIISLLVPYISSYTLQKG